jgi:hypothetical protein
MSLEFRERLGGQCNSRSKGAPPVAVVDGVFPLQITAKLPGCTGQRRPALAQTVHALSNGSAIR